MSRPRVVIVGGGPAGLTAAAALSRQIEGEVLVLDREVAMGGIPRHSDHPGYGMRDMRRFVTGPTYAQRLTELAAEAGATLETSAMVTGWSGERGLEVTSPRGRRIITADAIVLATGARERPRSARRIPGDRPDGVYTTGQLQNEVHLKHTLTGVGAQAVVIGAELVSWSAVMTLRDAGCRTVLMTTEHPKSESYAAFSIPGRFALKVPVAPHTRVTRIIGKGRVQAVEVEDLTSGLRRLIECDTVVTTGDWIPDNELVRLGGLNLDQATMGPEVDLSLRTSRSGVFAIGNLVHPVDTADAAAFDGKHVVDAVRRHLRGEPSNPSGLRLVAEPPLRWVTPQIWRPGSSPARGRLLFWVDELRNFPRVVVTQDGVQLNAVRLPWPAAPGRIFRVPSSVITNAKTPPNPLGGPLHLSLR